MNGYSTRVQYSVESVTFLGKYLTMMKYFLPFAGHFFPRGRGGRVFIVSLSFVVDRERMR